MDTVFARTRRPRSRLRHVATSFEAAADERLCISCPTCMARFAVYMSPDIDVLRAREAWDVISWTHEQEQAARVRLIADCPHHRARFQVDALTWHRLPAEMAYGHPQEDARP